MTVDTVSITDDQKGFSLIELMLYIAILAGIVTSLVVFSISISNSRNKNYVAQEVHANGRVALDLVAQRIMASTGVNTGSSTFGTDPGVLSLIMADGGKNPTVIDLDSNDGVLRIKEGVSAAVPITSSEVKIMNLVFTDLTSTGNRGNIRIEMTVDYDNSSGDPVFEYTKSWQTAVSLRQ